MIRWLQVTECVAGKPVVVVTWPGTHPALPAVMLNSHTDVVPVFPEHWTYPPFSAHKDEKGDIYGRGTQVLTVADILLDFCHQEIPNFWDVAF